jgi:uncharacterized membrane protein YkoI
MAVLGAAGGTLANSLAANADSATTATATTAAATVSPQPGSGPGGDPSQGGHTANGITETVLTGDTSTQAIAAAEAAEPGATVIRAETDAEGAKYEVHMKKSDGSTVTVKLDANFKVTGTQDGFGTGAPSGSSSSSSSSNGGA